eukprot:5256927-Amphidinium_carterae.1
MSQYNIPTKTSHARKTSNQTKRRTDVQTKAARYESHLFLVPVIADLLSAPHVSDGAGCCQLSTRSKVLRAERIVIIKT